MYIYIVYYPSCFVGFVDCSLIFLSPGEHRATKSQSALTCRNWTGGVINSLAPDPAPEPKRIGCTAALIGCTASRKVEICEAASGCQAEFGILRVVVKWSQFVTSLTWAARWTGAAARPVISLSSRLAIVVAWTRGLAPCGTIDSVGLINEYLDVFGGLLMDFWVNTVCFLREILIKPLCFANHTGS